MSKRAKKPSDDQLSLFDAPAPVVERPEAPPPPRPSRPAAQQELSIGDPRKTPPPPTPPPFRPERRADGSLKLPEALRLDANLALSAGAGTGKTHSLITLCLHVLAGARQTRTEPVKPEGLCLVTFTDKAAAEVRARLWRRVDRLARGDRGGEPELQAAGLELGRDFFSADHWRAVRERLSSATVSTFHALCQKLVVGAPGVLGGGLEILEERQAAMLVRTLAERVVLEALEAGEPDVEALCAAVAFGGPMSDGLTTWLVRGLAQLREDGVAPRSLRVASIEEAREGFRLELEKARAVARQTSTAKLKTEKAAIWAEAMEVLASLDEANFTSPSGYPRLDRLLRNERAEAFKQLKLVTIGSGETKHPLRTAWGAIRVAPFEATVVELLARLQRRHAEELVKRSAIDFTGLLVRARDLLVEHPEYRGHVQRRLGVLLVDEMQDTNRLQLELVCLLAEQRAGGPRAMPPATELGGLDLRDWPLEPAFLCAVGDRKQSIYEFRGADVTVTKALEARVLESGGGRAFLKGSFRAAPGLVSFFNQAFVSLLRQEGLGPGGVATSPEEDRPAELRTWDVGYQPDEDDLEPRRDPVPGPAVVRLVPTPPPEGEKRDVKATRAADADAVARYLAWLFASGRPVTRHRGHDPVPVRGRDVALLLRTFTHVEAYRQALVRHGVRHRVVQGRGFFRAQEVLDCAAFLALVVEPDAPIDLATVLRSPWVGLSDPSLLSLAPNGQGLDAHAVLTGRAKVDHLDATERERVGRLGEVWRALHDERDHLSLSALLETVLDAFAVRTAIAGTPYGEQALANLEKLQALAEQRDRDGVSVSAFVGELFRLADQEAREAQGELVDDTDEDAITICTVHQSKGLEWPVVVVAELFAQPQPVVGSLLYGRDSGLALRPPEVDDGSVRSPQFERTQRELSRRQAAEAKRLLYVALTRAAEQLVLGDLSQGNRLTWAHQLRSMFEEWAANIPPKLDCTVAVPTASLVVPPRVLETSAPVDDVVLARALARVAPPTTAAREVSLPVTQLDDFVQCPTRYRLAWLLGLPEASLAIEGATGPGSTKARGIAAHRLLELTPLAEAQSPGLGATLEALAKTEAPAEGHALASRITRFWRTPFGASLAQAGEGRVHRELPFALRLTSPSGFALVVRGQLDLLFEADDGSALVLDFKTTTRGPQGLAPHAFQLGAYALAASHVVRPGVTVRTAVAFLDDDDPSPLVGQVAALDGPALAAHAERLVQAQATGEWARQPRERCEALGCGYVFRCHGGKQV